MPKVAKGDKKMKHMYGKISKMDVRAEFNEFMKSNMMDCESCRAGFYEMLLNFMLQNKIVITNDGKHIIVMDVKDVV
jgi:putative component of toxin-antitoxin plasmid stabilization module